MGVRYTRRFSRCDCRGVHCYPEAVEVMDQGVECRQSVYPDLPWFDCRALAEEFDGPIARAADIAGCTGTLVGFWAPEEYQGVTVAGLHIHFIDADRTRGGHVLDFRLKGGRLSYGAYTGLSVQLPATEAFLGADLAYRDIDARIHETEG